MWFNVFLLILAVILIILTVLVLVLMVNMLWKGKPMLGSGFCIIYIINSVYQIVYICEEIFGSWFPSMGLFSQFYISLGQVSGLWYSSVCSILFMILFGQINLSLNRLTALLFQSTYRDFWSWKRILALEIIEFTLTLPIIIIWRNSDSHYFFVEGSNALTADYVDPSQAYGISIVLNAFFIFSMVTCCTLSFSSIFYLRKASKQFKDGKTSKMKTEMMLCIYVCCQLVGQLFLTIITLLQIFGAALESEQMVSLAFSLYPSMQILVTLIDPLLLLLISTQTRRSFLEFYKLEKPQVNSNATGRFNNNSSNVITRFPKPTPPVLIT